MKKIISLLMAAIFVFSMAVPSFAAVTVNDVAQPAAISSNDATGTDDVFNDVVNFFSGVFESIGNFFKWLFGIDSEEPKYDVTYYWDSSKTSVYEKRSYEKGSSIGSVPVPERTGYTFIGWYPELPDDMPSQDLEVYATWSVKKYTISFNTNGGTPIAAIAVAYGDPIVLPTPPTKEGCSFLGWDATYVTMPAKNITLNALWGAKHTAINFDTDGGSKVESIVQPIGTPVVKPQNPTKPGYTFLGWNGVIPAYQPEEDVTFIARWSPNTYTVKWVVEGSVKATKTYDCGALVSCPVVAFKEGYDFDCWVDGDGNAFVSGKTVMAPHDVTYTAKFRAKAYDYAFVSDGVTISEGTVNADTVLSVSEPTKTGYTFKGWTGNDGSTYAVGATITMPAKDVTYTAKWEVNSYNAVFKVDGAVYKTVPTNYGEIPVVAEPTKTGYVFVSWTPALKEMTETGAEYIAVFTEAGDTPYTINVYEMDVKGVYPATATSSETAKGKTGASINYTAPAKEGFTFDAAKSTVSGTIAADGTLVLSVYYKRNMNTFTVNGQTITGYYGAEFKVPAEVKKEGYTFGGWLGSDGKTYAAGATAQIPADANFTLEPIYTANVHSVKFMVNGEIWFEIPEIGFGEPITVPEDPSAPEGQIFEGWGADVPATMPDKDLTFTAVFGAASTHKVSFNANGGKLADGKTESTPVNVKRGDIIAVPDEPTPPAGKRFIGWAEFQDDGVYTEEDVITIGKMTYTRDIVFYAVYVTSFCEVTYIVDGKEITVDEKYAVVQIDSEVDPAAVDPETMKEYADKYGYSFSGWSIKSENGVDSKPDEDGKLPAAAKFTVTDDTKSIVYTGEFVANKHKVNFDIGDGKWPEGTWDKNATEGVIEVSYDSEIVAPALPNAPFKKVFLGWAEEAGSDKVIAEGRKIGTLTETLEDYVEGAEYTFYAVYAIDVYELNFKEYFKDENGNETTALASFTKTLAYGAAIDVSAYKPSEKPGYIQNEEAGFAPEMPAKINLETLAELKKAGAVKEELRTDKETSAQYTVAVITFDVVYEPVEYKVYFSGCNYMTVKVPCDANINDYVDAIPKAEGKTFRYWNDESGKQFGTWSSDGKTYNLGTMPPNDIELHAVWKVNTYTITFETDIGGTKIEAKEYEFGKTVAKVDDPVRTGYTFVRWEPSIPETMPSKDVTVVAVWDANDITISFDTAGGQPTSIAPVTQDYGTDATLPAAPTKKGHTFKGWLASNGTAYDALETIQMPSSNMKFTADWEVNKYTVKFDVNGGKAVDNMIDKDYGTVINVKTEKPGHKLSGWTGWTLDASGNKVGDGIFYKNLPTTIPDADMEFKAEWDCVDHFIYFHPAAIPVDDPETKDVDERLTADKNMITLEFDCNADIVTPTEAEVKAAGYDYETKIGIGKIIKGWNDADGNAIAAKMTYDMVGKHYVISAWVDELYTVTFDSNGGTSVPSQSLNYGDAIVEPAEPTKEGHDFVDWIDEKGYVVDFKNLKLTEAKNVTFTAKWQVKEYDVIWSVDEEEYKSETYEYGETIAKPKDPVKEGHTFTGWSGYTEGETKMGAADTVFEATWTVNEYKATFDPNGGVLIIKNKDGSVITTDEPYTFDIKYGNPVTAPELESRDGYVFSSWVDSADQQPMPATMPAKDVTFNALWNGAEGVKYTVYYYSMNTEGVYAKTEAGEYVYTSYKEDSGKTGTTASVTPKEIEGFTVDSGMSTLSGKITADGKLKLHVFYARNQYDLVTVVDGKETSRTAYYYEATIPTGAPELPKDTEEIDYPEVWTWAWASKDADGNPVVDTTKPATMPATEVTASMTSGPMLYTITLYSAGDMENPKVPYNTVFDVVTLGTPKMEGYTFAGWTDADENGKEVTTFTVTSDTKLYAQWTPDVYTATFYNSDPATNAKTGAPIGTKQIAYGEVVTYTAPTAPEGYKFKGWLADGVIYDGNDKMTVGNKDFVAQWTAVTE